MIDISSELWDKLRCKCGGKATLVPVFNERTVLTGAALACDTCGERYGDIMERKLPPRFSGIVLNPMTDLPSTVLMSKDAR